MIKVIADTIEELSLAKSIIDKGVINNHSPFGEFDDSFAVSYSLSNGRKLVTNKLNDIIGEVIVGENGEEYTKYIINNDGDNMSNLEEKVEKAAGEPYASKENNK